jgi:hypothetical protein
MHGYRCATPIFRRLCNIRIRYELSLYVTGNKRGSPMYMSSGLSKRQTTAVGASFGNAGIVAGACGRTADGLQFPTIFDNNLSNWFAERFRTILFNVLYNFVAFCHLLTAHHRTTDQARQRRRSLGRLSFSPARSCPYKHAATPFAPTHPRTLPNTTCLPLSHGVSAVQIKN